MNISTLTTKHWKMALLLFITLPFSYDCVKAPSEPVMPKWTTQLTVQLLKRTYFFDDMIRKDSAKFSTIDGELVYKPASINNAPEPITIPNMSPVSAAFVRSLGLIPISSVTVPGINLSFKDMTGQDPPAFPWILGEQSVNKDTTIVSDSASYDYLIYEEGVMSITVANTFNFDINFATPIELVNADNPSEIVGTFPIGTVPKNNGSVTASSSLNGKRMSSVLGMKFAFQTVDLNGKTVNNGAISAIISITKNGTPGTNATLSEAKMRLLQEFVVPVTSITDSVQQIDDSIQIKTADFKDGQFDIIINNQIPFDVRVGFKLREFVDHSTQQSFKLIDTVTNQPNDSITIGGKQLYRMNVQMKDYQLQARKEDGISSDTLTSGIHFSLDIKTLVQSIQKAVIKKTDSVEVKIVPGLNSQGTTEYIVDSVQGKIPPNTIKINETTAAGIGQSNDNFSADSVKFDGAQIILKIFTNSLFPTDLKFVVKAKSDGTITDSLTTPRGTGLNASFDDADAYRIFPGDTAKIIFDKANPDANGKTIDQFLSKFIRNGRFAFPEEFNIEGQAVIEPKDQYASTDPSSVGKVKNGDSVFTSLDFSFPLKIGIVNGLYLADTAEIASNVDTSMTSSIVEGTIGFSLASTFPVALDIYSNLIKADALDPTKPSTDTLTNSVMRFPQDSTKLPLGVPGALDNQVKIEYRDITLTGDDAKKISDAKFNAVEIKMRTAADGGNTPLAFVRDDSIQVVTIANIKFKVDFDKFK
ncbi:MAG: hypothetical protein WCW35_11465 [Bacteroidota bacterium]